MVAIYEGTANTTVNCFRGQQLQCTRTMQRIPPSASGLADVRHDAAFMRRLEESIAQMPQSGATCIRRSLQLSRSCGRG